MKRKLPFSVDARNATRIVTFNRASALAGKLADMKLPRPLLRAAIRAYSSFFNVNLAESRRQPAEFDSFGEFFARDLKEGLRPISGIAKGLVSPADGTLHNFGTVRSGMIPQVKGHDYSLAELLQDDEMAGRFQDGTYATIYLSPSDYHRVHSPISGKITCCRYIPGALFSVSPMWVNSVRNLFTTNERIPIYLKTRYGTVCVVMVGAAIVGRVTLNFSHLATNCFSREEEERFSPPVTMKRGEELGAFRMGSTVVLLMEGSWIPRMLAEGMPIRMGAPLFKKA